MSQAQLDQAEQLYQQALQAFSPEESPDESIELLRTVTHRFPLWVKGTLRFLMC